MQVTILGAINTLDLNLHYNNIEVFNERLSDASEEM